MLHRLTVTFSPTDGRSGWPRDEVWAKSLHGLLFDTVLPAYDPGAATWLHEHETPKPFALAPVYNKEKLLVGMSITSWSEQAAAALSGGWRAVHEAGREISLGPLTFCVGNLIEAEAVEFAALLPQEASQTMKLNFTTPTAFRQGPLRLHLPLPVNVFARPFSVWQAYAPTALSLPSDWLDWCEQSVMVEFHNIRTVTALFSRHVRFVGYIGKVLFKARSKQSLHLQLWQGLGNLATYCGVGYKTTMGMGAVQPLRGHV